MHEVLIAMPAQAGIQCLCVFESASMKQPAVYILASGRNGTLYTGVTSDLIARTWQHREHATEGFTSKYGVTMLVWHEMHGDMESAIRREKQIKAWKREWKIRLIEEFNPYWNDLWPRIIGSEANDTGCLPAQA